MQIKQKDKDMSALKKLAVDNSGILERDQKGQALLFVIVALTVGLAVGISTALRTLSSISRVTTTDTSVRVLAAAEGGLEHFLSYTSPHLRTAVNTCNTLGSSADSACIIEFPPITTDNITARATVMVEEFRGDPQDRYRYRTHIKKGDSITLNLENYQGHMYVCWLGESDLFYNYFNGNNLNDWTLSGGDSGQGVLCAQSGAVPCYSGSGNYSNVTNAAATPSACSVLGADYHGYRFSIPSGGSAGTLQKGMAFIALNDDVSFVVENSTGTSPFTRTLGYKITSKGELLENATVKTTKIVSVTRSLPFLSPNLFFGIFANGGIDYLGTYMAP